MQAYWFLRRPEGELIHQEGKKGAGEGSHPEDPVVGPVPIHHCWPKRPGSCSNTLTDIREKMQGLLQSPYTTVQSPYTTAGPDDLTAAATHRQISANTQTDQLAATPKINSYTTAGPNNLAAAATHRQIPANAQTDVKDQLIHHCWLTRSGSCSNTQTDISYKMQWWLQSHMHHE